VSAASPCIGDLFFSSLLACSQAEAARAKGHDLKQSTDHGNVLEEVDKLVLVREIVVKDKRCRKGEDSKPCRHEAGAIAGDERKAAKDLYGNGKRESEGCQR
jgi:hypothetical protein